MKDKIVVSVLGNRDSGKTRTWTTLFGQTVRTGQLMRRLYLTESESVEVFLVSGSPEETHKYVGKTIAERSPRIVLCSMQYGADVTGTIDYFHQHKYSIYTQWLNPGYSDTAEVPDSRALMPYLLKRRAIFSIRDGKVDPRQRVQELNDFIYGWASSRGLLQTSTVELPSPRHATALPAHLRE